MTRGYSSNEEEEYAWLDNIKLEDNRKHYTNKMIAKCVVAVVLGYAFMCGVLWLVTLF